MAETLAVKRLSTSSGQGAIEFKNETYWDFAYKKKRKYLSMNSLLKRAWIIFYLICLLNFSCSSILLKIHVLFLYVCMFIEIYTLLISSLHSLIILQILKSKGY